MSHKTFTNGYTHTHEERPFTPPHENPLDQESQRVFGCSSQGVIDRTERCEKSAVVAFGAILDALRLRVFAETGEVDDAILDLGIAGALIRYGASGMFIKLTGAVSAGKEFGICVRKDVVNMLSRKFNG